jgi:long-subunit fatty acid transport protein
VDHLERFVKGKARWNSLLADVPSDDTTNWSLGVQYRYTPSLAFELAYDKIENSQAIRNSDDHLLRFRTHVTF